MASSRTIFSDSYFVRWYGEGRCWPSSNIVSSNRPWYSPAAATEDTWWKQPTFSFSASSRAWRVPPTFIASLVSSSAVMS